MSNKNDRTNVIHLIGVNRFKHDGLSYSLSEIKLLLQDNLTHTDNIPQRDGIR